MIGNGPAGFGRAASEKDPQGHLADVVPRRPRQAQLERNVESTARQYALVERAVELGFAREQVVVIDEDLGHLRLGAL